MNMRLSSVVAAALVLAMSGPIFAQEYVEYVSKQDRFTATFPVEPKVTDFTFKSQFNSMLPARTYTAEGIAGRFKVTVVDYNNIEAIATEKAKTCPPGAWSRSEEHTSELQSLRHLVCRLLL